MGVGAHDNAPVDARAVEAGLGAGGGHGVTGERGLQPARVVVDEVALGHRTTGSRADPGPMQTFVPEPSFRASAEVLDDRRLGKQRVEVLQILRALHLPGYGWATHPAVTMWQGHTEALVVYGLAVVDAWLGRGYADSTQPQIAEFAPEAVRWSQDDLERRGLLPPWLGDDAVHRSHRSALVRKDPAFYRARYPDVPDDVPYSWPDPPGERPGLRPGTAVTVPAWVVRPPSRAALGAFLELGVAGLDAASGLVVDCRGWDHAELVARLKREAPRRRPGKALGALEDLLHRVEVGDAVLLPIDRGQALLVGEVTGAYRFAGSPERGIEGLHHLRDVRWAGRVDRGAVRPPAALQDPRSLFAVRVEAAPLGRTAVAAHAAA